MNGIGWAVKMLQLGRRVCREGWNGKGQWLELQTPDKNSKMSRPYVFIRTVQDRLVPWVSSQTDLLASDWMIAPGPDGLASYRSHKVVQGLKIATVKAVSGGARLVGPGGDVVVTGEYVTRSQVMAAKSAALRNVDNGGIVGGYYMRYDDGFESWSPADAFEGGYTLIGG